jgi:hypothetical protein
MPSLSSAVESAPKMSVQLEPGAGSREATANPPYLFDLGPEKGRSAVDETRSGLELVERSCNRPASKPTSH